MNAVLGANVSAGVAAGPHVCALYSTEAERRALLDAYFHNRPGERLIYVGAPSDITSPAGIDVREPDEVYLGGGSFDPDGVLDGFRGEIDQALAAGHRRLRVAADMTWAADGTDPEVLVAYEAGATQLHKEGTAAGMCLYDRRRFSEAHLDALCAAHPFTSDTVERLSPAAFTAFQDPDGTLCVLGEIDYFGASHLVTLINDRADLGEDVVIDVSGVRFVDASVVHALQAAATALVSPRRLILRSPSRVVSRLLALLPPAGTGALVIVDEALPAP